MFILATTEPQKLPATILSRCLRLDFKRVPQALLMEGMRRICAEKGVSLTDSALKLLANCADGSVRDGLSVLDQVLASGQKQIDRSDVLEYIGAGSFNLIRNGTFLTRVSETEFEVVAKTSFAKRFAEQKREQLETIMEHKLGRRLRMLCVEEKDYRTLQAQTADGTRKAGGVSTADRSAGDPEVEHLMQLAKDALGIEIEIE